MVSAPPIRRRPAAAPAAPPTKLVCFRLGGWRVGLTVDEVRGLFVGLPLIPTSNPDYSGEVQLAFGRVPVLDMRHVIGTENSHRNGSATIALVDTVDGPLGLAFDHADEVIPVHPRAWLHQELSVAPLPVRARTVTRYGDVFWLNLDKLNTSLDV
ncbi:chemotaxis protein CheW [bacterium]|nr:chemotaxis protein CheW [bacterium]